MTVVGVLWSILWHYRFLPINNNQLIIIDFNAVYSTNSKTVSAILFDRNAHTFYIIMNNTTCIGLTIKFTKYK